jgi:hypothetical protein
MHANSLETAASKGGQTNGPPKTPHLNVGRSSLTNKARYDQDVVTAQQPTVMSKSLLFSDPMTPKGAAKQDSRSVHKYCSTKMLFKWTRETHRVPFLGISVQDAVICKTPDGFKVTEPG